MAVIGQWSGGTIAVGDPGLTFNGPNGMFPTQDRNDGSAYTFTSSTSSVQIPATPADGYLLIGFFEYEDSSNGRYMPKARFVQTSGTGTINSNYTGGFSRDNSEDRSYVRVAAVVDNPSGSSVFQFQWARDVDPPGTTDGTVRSVFQIMPLPPYTDIAFYSHSTTTTTDNYGGTTRNVFDLSAGTDGTNITRSGNTITVSGTNKNYLILSNPRSEEICGAERTQRVYGHRYDSTDDVACQAYNYFRFASNNENGAIITDILSTTTSSRTIQFTGYRGPTQANQGGADIDGTPHATDFLFELDVVVIELADTVHVVRSHNGSGGQDISNTTAVDLNVASNVDKIDSSTFSSTVSTAIEVATTGDYLVGMNLFGARTNAKSSVDDAHRLTSFAELTVNGTEQSLTAHGNYLRGDQGSEDCYGFGVNLLSALALTANDDIGASIQALAGSEGADEFSTNADATLNGSLGFWAITLDAQAAAGVTITGAVTLDDWTTTGEIDVQNNITGAITLDDWTTDGTIAVQNDITGAVTLDDWTTDGAIQVAIDIAGAITLDDWTTDGTITVVDPITVTGAVTLDDWTTTGTVEALIDITGAITLDDWNTTSTASVDISTTGAITLDDWITTGTVEVDISITGAVTLDDWTTAGTIETPIDITGAVTLDDWTTTGTIATVAVTQITGAVTLDDWTTDGAIQTDIAISGAVVLDDWGVNGTIQTDVDITGAVTLNDWTAAGAVAVDVGISGAITLDDWTTTGQIVLDAGTLITGAVVLDDWQTAGQITVDIDINSAIVLDDWVTDGIIDTGAEELDDGLGGGHGAIIRQQYRQKEEKTATTDEELMLLAVIAINEYYD